MAKKMVLVDPKILESLSNSDPVPDAKAESLRKLNRDLSEAVSADEEKLPSERATELQQLLFQFLKRYAQVKKPSPPPLPPPPPPPSSPLTVADPPPSSSSTTDEDPVTKEVMDSVPKSLKKNTRLLLDRIKRDQNLTWNERGEVIYRGRLVEKSNLTDLINDVLRKRKRESSPEGWETFATALKRMNAPKNWIGNPDRWDYMIGGDAPSSSAAVIKKPSKTTRRKKQKTKKSEKMTWEEMSS